MITKKNLILEDLEIDVDLKLFSLRSHVRWKEEKQEQDKRLAWTMVWKFEKIEMSILKNICTVRGMFLNSRERDSL